MPTLFDPVKIGALELKNRIIMAPLTRMRAEDERTPGPLSLTYYVQRASAGLIFTEATSVTPQGVGYPNTPGIWSEKQVQAWKAIVDAVHEAGGKIVCQLWHVGRVSDPIFLDGALPVAPSAIPPEGHVTTVRPMRPYETPRALETDEIPGIVEDFVRAAENARRAGFDGVEIHAANGYLFDQFLHDGSNKRTDQYGGSIENRARFLLETVDAVLKVWPADRLGVHLNLMSNSYSMEDSNPKAMFSYMAQQLSERHLLAGRGGLHRLPDVRLSSPQRHYPVPLFSPQGTSKIFADETRWDSRSSNARCPSVSSRCSTQPRVPNAPCSSIDNVR